MEEGLVKKGQPGFCKNLKNVQSVSNATQKSKKNRKEKEVEKLLPVIRSNHRSYKRFWNDSRAQNSKYSSHCNNDEQNRMKVNATTPDDYKTVVNAIKSPCIMSHTSLTTMSQSN